MKNFKISIIALFAFILLGASNPVNPEAEIEWITFEEAIELTKKKPKKVFIDVYTDWCGWCKRMDATTFNHPEVKAMMSENFYMVKLDGEQKADIEFKGNTFKFVPNGRRGYHELAAALLQGKLSYPTVVFMDEDMNMIQAIPGYRGPQDFYKIGKYIGEDHHKKTPWPEWEKSVKLPF